MRPLGVLLLLAIVPAVPASAQVQTALPEWGLTGPHRFGGSPGHDLARVSGSAMDTAGRLYLGQPMEGAIRVFGPDGRHEKTLGRRGGGPGEFLSIHRLGLVADSVWAVDARQGRISWFHNSGKHLHTDRYVERLAELGYPRAVVGAALAKGGLIVEGAPDPRIVGRSDSASVAVELVSASDRPVVLLRRLVTRYRLLVAHDGGHVLSTYQPLDDSPLWTTAERGNRVYVLERPAASRRGTSSFTLSAYRSDGEALWNRSFPYRPVPVSKDEVDRHVESVVRDVLADSGPSGELTDAARKALYLPPFHPPVRNILAGADGTIWLELFANGDERHWIVLDRNGRGIGELRIPDRPRVLAASREVVWILALDALDVPHLVRYEINTVP